MTVLLRMIWTDSNPKKHIKKTSGLHPKGSRPLRFTDGKKRLIITLDAVLLHFVIQVAALDVQLLSCL